MLNEKEILEIHRLARLKKTRLIKKTKKYIKTSKKVISKEKREGCNSCAKRKKIKKAAVDKMNKSQQETNERRKIMLLNKKVKEKYYG